MRVTPHRLAAIVFTDISGYTSLMGENEPKAMRILKTNQEIHLDSIKKFNCIYHKQMGDGFMAVFNSLNEAVYASAQILDKTKKADINIRIGIHEGEVIFQDNDVYGDGVNIAARLEQTAKPGCIYVSESVYRNLINKPGISSSFVEEAKLKNVKEPLKLFQICVDRDTLPESLPGSELSNLQEKGIKWEILALLVVVIALITYFTIPLITGINSTSINQKKIHLPGNSIAVLPFDNQSDNEEFDYLGVGFADGVLTKLSMLNDFKVVSRASSFNIAAGNTSLKEIAKQLGVSMILEGSYQVIEDEIRIHAKLVGVEENRNLLTEIYEGKLKNIFKLQDEASEGLYKLLGRTGFETSTPNPSLRQPSSMEAYKHYQEGLSLIKKGYVYKSDILQSRKLFQKSSREDPTYVDPIVALSETFFLELFYGYNSIFFVKDSIEKYISRADKINPHNGQLLTMKGAILFYEFKFDEAMKLVNQGIELNPNYPFNYFLHSWFSIIAGDSASQLRFIDKAISLDPFNSQFQTLKIIQSIYLNDFDTSETMINASLEKQPGNNMALFLKGMMLCQQKKYREALDVLLMRSVGDTTNFLVAYAHGKVGNTMQAEKITDFLVEKQKIHFISPTTIALAYLGLEDKEKALMWMEKAYLQLDPFLFWTLLTMFEPLHENQRFIELLKRFNLFESFQHMYNKDQH